LFNKNTVLSDSALENLTLRIFEALAENRQQGQDDGELRYVMEGVNANYDHLPSVAHWLADKGEDLGAKSPKALKLAKTMRLMGLRPA